MRSLHALIILLMILSAFCIAPAAAVNGDASVNFEILGPDVLNDISRAPPVQGSVTQGETKYHTYYVESGKRTLELQLTWDSGNGNDLDLVIYPPNQASIEVHDSTDSIIDGKISVRSTLQESLTSNNWNFNVPGARVSGTQAYTLIINAY